MRKLSLKLDELSVETFETSEALEERGTVRGAESTANQIMCTCTFGEETCDETCAGTCYCTNNCTVGCGQNTREHTCATGNQIDCHCWG